MAPSATRRRRSRSRQLVLAAAVVLQTAPAGFSPARAMDSPWWENYDQKDRFACGSQGVLVVERNDAQASLISGRGRVILFREASDGPGAAYRNDDLHLILRGDELTIERLPMRLVCLRTEQA